MTLGAHDAAKHICLAGSMLKLPPAFIQKGVSMYLEDEQYLQQIICLIYKNNYVCLKFVYSK